MTQEMDDQDGLIHSRLIQAVALERDREAFARLFVYFAPRLKAWLIKSGAAPGAAEDFAQEAMLTVWRKADLFDPRKAGAATWIFTIARNRRLDMLRRDSRPLPTPEIALAGEEIQGPDEVLSMAEDAERVRQALSQLDGPQVEVLRLAFFLESPHSEIARRLGLPLGTVKSRIRNAMIRLRSILEQPQERSK
jgi:RNA polymerase sigma-70 factor (ECF subfamily)